MKQVAIGALALLASTSIATAGAGSWQVIDAGGTTRTFDVTTDGAGHFVPWAVICDQAAAAQCASVTASNALKVDGSAVTQPTNQSQIGGTSYALGAATSAASAPVVIASDQAAVAVKQATAANLNATVVGTGTFATQTTLSAGTAVAGAFTISDGLGGSQQAAVKAASTVAIATDPSLVVQASPNGAFPNNLKQINGTGILQGAGAVGTGSARVAVGQDTTTIAGSAPGTAGTASANVLSVQGIASGTNLGVAQATASALNATVTPTAGTFAGCAGATAANTKVKPFSNAGSASNLLLAAGTASQNTYVCAIDVGPVAGAVNVALVEGTTVTNPCDTSTAGLTGGATAATGWQFSANGGLTMGNGKGILAKTATLADNVCLLFSAGVQVSGVITYVEF